MVGWREWIALPDLNIPAIKAKIDTGARTSALHAFAVDEFRRNGGRWVRFALRPSQDVHEVVRCELPLKDQRLVRDSGGHTEERYVVETRIALGGESWPVEMTLTSRDDMRFRMLLGRTAMRRRLIVDPGKSFLAGDASAIVKGAAR